ncbi:PREDICTED: uncharacterized protein LOC105555666 [Vollenhovia emeryi]|uniref:uncharacterized protein LOC105555666 n=1 Tax=Vollenhovia emeryi TaxID=411798 RepID=UPI0005F52904|nr:PREDICTED: uncharacterized protein LOC105555666 [Vollenhovia emeryi]
MATLSATEAKGKRTAIKAMATRIRHFIEQADTAQLSRFDLSERKKRLSELWEQYVEVQSRIEALDLAKPGDRTEDVLTKLHADERASFETPYFNLMSRLESVSLEIERREAQTIARPQNSSTQSRNNPVSTQLRLPKIELPSFSGEYEDWYSFYDTFEKLINANPDLPAIQKFHYLKSAVHGPAAELLKSFEITTEHYSEAWGLLVERYDNRRHIVYSHIKSLFELPVMSKENHTQMRALLDGIGKHLRALKAMDRPVDTWDDLIIHLIQSKLDIVTKREWETSRSGSTIPTLKELKEFLLQRCLALESITSKSDNTSQRSKRAVTNAVTANLCCEHCKGEHLLYHCESFKKLPVEKRFKIVKGSHLCINCLRSRKHQAKNCPSSSCRKCQGAHNTLLHYESNAEQKTTSQGASTEVKEPPSSPVVTQCLQQNPSKVLLSTAVIHVRDSKGKSHACRALLDSGSQLNFVTEDFANKLHLNKHSINMPISGIAEGSFEARNSVDIHVQSRFNTFQARLNCIVLPRITQKLPREFIHRSHVKIPSNIRLADPNFNVPSDIDLLIGAEVFWQLLCIGQVKGSGSHPTLQKTKLGWVLSGHITGSQRRDKGVSCYLTTMEELDRNISRFWRLENDILGNANAFSSEEVACETLFQQSTSRNEEGRFIVKLPVKEDVLSQLGESKQIAERRFFALEKRLSKQPEVYKEYRDFMREYQELGHMYQVHETPDSNNRIHYYLPHHAVFKHTSTITKLRVVFDASCKTESGRSLNDALLVGPIIQQDLFSILVRFRTFSFAMTADIAKMYRQVLINPHQRCLQRILWRDTSQHELQTFELATVTYGTASASFLAIRSLQKLAQDGTNSYPLGSQIVLRDFYVDDMLTGASTIEEALDIKNQVTTLLEGGGFELRKWFSNSPSVCNDENSSGNKEIASGSEHDRTRTLGVSWNCQQDTFHFTNVVEYRPPSRLTKRNILSRIALIFDPLGLLGPTIVIGKLVMQELWMLRVDWDESISMELGTKWQNYEKQLKCLNNLAIPRKIVVDRAGLIELHGFADASQRAYGACVYLRSSMNNDEFTVRLIASKSRVAPVKGLSIPRLELCGALLLAQLVTKLRESLNLQIDTTYYWTDSSIVIHWLRGSSRNWTTFVANRVGQIQSLTSIEDWRHISSKENPADALSRGIMPEELLHSNMWWYGPEWLKSVESHWPISAIDIPNDIPDRRRPDKTFSFHVTASDLGLFERYSSYEKLIRIVAYCLRFINAVKHKRERFSRDCSSDSLVNSMPPLSCEELENAKLTLVKNLQERFFNDEIRDISNRGNVSRRSSILRLNPFVDKKGVLRVGGRLKNANLPFDAKHPIVIPGRHVFTRLIVMHEHKRLLHAGAQMTLSSIRQMWWPCAGRSVVRDVISKCVTCFRNAPKSSTALMGDLPESRVSVFERPFEKCGVDYAGPMYYKEGQRKNARQVKCFIAIFVCFATKATHIELVGDLTTETFLNALKRFISRRGRPSDIYSDNGLNFVGAERQLSELYAILNEDVSRRKIMDAATNERIKWHFIPPRAPHMGGLWEAAVKSAKFHIKRIMGEASVRYEEFLTLLAQVEAVLNSRPLTPLSADPNDFSALTPAHFLIGCPITSYPEPSLIETNVNRLTRRQRIEQLRQHFWKRWTNEYLHNCQQRNKWNTVEAPVTVGQLVIIQEDNLPPLVWALGRIQEVYPGKDKAVRTALVRTAKGVYKRPVTKLCILPID